MRFSIKAVASSKGKKEKSTSFEKEFNVYIDVILNIIKVCIHELLP